MLTCWNLRIFLGKYQKNFFINFNIFCKISALFLIFMYWYHINIVRLHLNKRKILGEEKYETY